jgi:polygalacturonase
MTTASRIGILAVLLVTIPATLRAQSTARFVITEFGAVDDGKTMNTQAIQKTIDKAAESGGGTVVIPKGTYLSGAVFLKKNVNLHVEKDGVLKGSEDTKDYPEMMTRIEGHFQNWLPALINADSIDGLRISGEGTLDGSGPVYWKAFDTKRAADRNTKNLDVPRPRLMFIRDSKDVQVTGLRFKDSGFWNLHIYRCDGVVLDGLDFRAAEPSPSTDGTDIDSCRNVTIKNCYYAVSDDCIALKGTKGPLAMEDKDSPPVEHIRVDNCTFERGNGFITCGSEATIVRDVVLTNCKAVGPRSYGIAVLRLKMRTDTPQLYEDMHFSDITLEGDGSVITIAPWSQYFDLQGHPQPTRHVNNISIKNVKGSFGSLGSLRGGPGDVIENITLENIDIKTQRPPTPLTGVKNLVPKNVKVNGEEVTAPPATAPAN